MPGPKTREIADLERQLADYEIAARCNRDEIRCLRAEVGRLKVQLENLYSEDPCPHCGCGVSAQCYGCLWKKAEAEAERLRQKLEGAEAEHPTGVWLERGLRNERDKMRRDLDLKDHQIAALKDELAKAWKP